MKNKTLALLVAASFAAPTLASAKDFTGFGAGVELQVKSTDFEYTESETGSFTETSTYGGESQIIGAVNLWYGFNLTPSWLIQVGATADLMKTKTDLWTLGANNQKLEEKNHYSVYVAPGYRVTPSTIVYGKLAYHQMDGKYTWVNCGGSCSGTWFDKTFRGFGLGAGVSTMFTNNLYGYVEAQHVMYGDKDVYVSGTYSENMKPTSTIGSIGLGWNF